MAVQFSLSIFVLFATLRWCNADEQPVPRTMSQLRSILSFLPRAQKCDKLLFDLMKECVHETDTTVAPTTTVTPELPEEIPVTLKTVPRPSPPADDEDSNMEGSGFSYINALPLKEYKDYRQSYPKYSTRKTQRKTNRKKPKKNKRLLKLKKVNVNRKPKSSRKNQKENKKLPTYSTSPAKIALRPPPPKVDMDYYPGSAGH